MEIGGTNGTVTFSLPETNGRTVHRNEQQSPCSYKDSVNTTETVDEDVPSIGGDFSFSFPIDTTGKIIRGSITVMEEDGAKTEYSWELRQK